MSCKTILLLTILSVTCIGMGAAADPDSSENTNTVPLATFVITIILAFFAGYLSVPDFSVKCAKSFDFLRHLGCLAGSPVSIKGHQVIKKTTFEIFRDFDSHDGSKKWIVERWIDAMVGFFKADEEKSAHQFPAPEKTCFVWKWIEDLKGMFKSDKATPQADEFTEPSCKKEIIVTAIVSVICTAAVSVGLIVLCSHYSQEIIQFGHTVLDGAGAVWKSIMETGNKIISYISSKLGLQ
jgi:hypothetical protein